jgi:hypothetical protein
MSIRPSPVETATSRRVRNFNRARAGWWYLAAQLVLVIALVVILVV